MFAIGGAISVYDWLRSHHRPARDASDDGRLEDDLLDADLVDAEQED